jgi:hypothetical protein
MTTAQLSVAVRNARLDAIETTVGTTPKLQMFTGAMPANCATASSGTKLLEDTLASDWAANASGGSKNLNNTPIAGTGLAAGTAGYFRIVDSGGTCHLQGTITATGGGGDMTIDNVVIATGQTVNVTSFSMTDGNA